MKRLTILSVAYPLLEVGGDSGGGAERILQLLDAGLVQAGFDSVVVAAEGSRVAGELMATTGIQGEITDRVREEARQVHRRRIGEALARKPVDLIHFHGLDFHSYQQAARRVPQLATLHLPIGSYPRHLFDSLDICLNCVSKEQARLSPAARALPVIQNGIDLESFRIETKKQDYLVWLGRICPEKGVHIALRVARRLGMPIVVAGPVHPFSSHQIYFNEQVEPLLDDKRRYLGPVKSSEKKALLAGARCLLAPSLVAETSSLVAMEAIGSGTPVIAFRSGALPEIVEEGRTGFLVDSEDEMAAAIGRTGEISPATCRSVAEQRFQARRMVAEYICLYGQIIRSHRAREVLPKEDH